MLENMASFFSMWHLLTRPDISPYYDFQTISMTNFIGSKGKKGRFYCIEVGWGL